MDERRKADRLRPDRRPTSEPAGRARRPRNDAPRTPWDTAVTKALGDLPVPAGLAQRVVMRLRSAERSAPVENDVGMQHTRRSWWTTAAATALACAAGIGLAIFWFGQSIEDVGPESIAQLARGWHNREAAESVEIERGRGPADYPLGSYVLPGFVEGWHRLPHAFFSREGVAYRLLTAAGRRATLYVVDYAGSRLAPRILVSATTPTENLLSTDGQTSASWTDGQRLYVLVVDGDEGDLRSLVRASRSMA
jgi:hypothetical protein